MKISTFAAGGCLLGFPLGMAEAGPSHVVQAGETLDRIARDYGTTVAELRRVNGIEGDLIVVGQVLRVPAGATEATINYTVQPGDSLGRIAREHGVSVTDIRSANNLRGDLIHPGQELDIPGGSGSSSRRYIGNVVAATRRLRVDTSRWRYIVGHHSGVNTGNAEIYDRFHSRQRRMPNGLAYHFVIGNGSDSGDGEVEIGNRWTTQIQGGHVRDLEVNRTGIGICVVGNFEQRRPTRAQVAAFIELVDYLKNDLTGGSCRFAVHREIDGQRTLCPGRNFPTRDMHRRFS